MLNQQADEVALLPNRALKIYTNTTNKFKERQRLLVFIMAIAFASCLFVYFYLNMEVIKGSNSIYDPDIDLDDEDSSDSLSAAALGYNNNNNKINKNPNKPLSRRKPILDNESIFSESGPSMIRLSDLLAHCNVALKIAGRDVIKSSLQHQDQLDEIRSKGLTKEGLDDPVTGADMRSHHTILRIIKDSYPRLKIVSEEDETKGFNKYDHHHHADTKHKPSKLRDNHDLLPIDRSEFAGLLRSELHDIQNQHAEWGSLIAQDETLVWIDPLDATKEYSENLTNYVTLMACIVYKSEPIAGVIYKPFANQTFWSILDQNSKLHHHSNDLTLALEGRSTKSSSSSSSPSSRKDIKIIVSRSHAGDVKNKLSNVYAGRDRELNIISSGGSGFKTIELVSGNADAYVHVTRIKKWDICAPNAIIDSIDGGKFTDRNGHRISYGSRRDKLVQTGLIASLDSQLHQDLIDNLRMELDGENANNNNNNKQQMNNM